MRRIARDVDDVSAVTKEDADELESVFATYYHTPNHVTALWARWSAINRSAVCRRDLHIWHRRIAYILFLPTRTAATMSYFFAPLELSIPDGRERPSDGPYFQQFYRWTFYLDADNLRMDYQLPFYGLNETAVIPLAKNMEPRNGSCKQ